MDWDNILNLQAWTPLSEIDTELLEPVMDGVYKVGADAYLLTRPNDPRHDPERTGGPFVTLAYWSPSLNGLRRVVSADSAAYIDEPLLAPPAVLALGTTGLYSELMKPAALTDSRPFEHAEYSNKGKFLNRIISLGRMNYCFASHQNNDERTFLIEIRLRK